VSSLETLGLVEEREESSKKAEAELRAAKTG